MGDFNIDTLSHIMNNPKPTQDFINGLNQYECHNIHIIYYMLTKMIL